MNNNQVIKPKRLSIGDKVGIISPSAPLAGLVPHRVKRSIDMLREMGFKTEVGKHALEITNYTAGGPESRARDINAFFEDDSVMAIIAFVGGNHSNQIIKYLDFNIIRKKPKIFIGYSDVTVLHFALLTQASLVTFYGPAALTQFAENPKILDYTKEYFCKALMEKEAIGEIKPSLRWTDETLNWFEKDDLRRPRKMMKNPGWQWIKGGKATGPLLGGCISSMVHLKGTKYWPNFSGCILFWEIPESEADYTKGESLANIDSYLTDLELLGTFSRIKGMVVGRPFGYDESQNKELILLIRNKFKEYNFPILFNIDIGHSDPMATLPMGVEAKLDSELNRFEIIESGVV